MFLCVEKKSEFNNRKTHSAPSFYTAQQFHYRLFVLLSETAVSYYTLNKQCLHHPLRRGSLIPLWIRIDY